MQVSRICLGCMGFGDTTRWIHKWVLNEEDSRPIIEKALDLGINFFDTANVYSIGTSEEILGRALHDFANRDEVVIATKLHGKMREGPNGGGLSRKAILSEIDHSLRRLGTDYIDLYYAHFPDPDTPLDQTLSAYDDLVRHGKLRYVALSNHPAWQVTQALWIADDRRLAATPVCVQVKYNLIDRAAERELAPACVRFGLSIVPFGPLHGGLLAGTQVEEREFSGDKRFGGSGFTGTELEVGRAVERLSQDWSLQPYQVSLAWLLSRPAVASAIVGAETVEEITANATAADVKLEQAQLDALAALQAGDNNSDD